MVTDKDGLSTHAAEILLTKATKPVRMKAGLMAIAQNIAEEKGMDLSDYISLAVYEQILRDHPEAF